MNGNGLRFRVRQQWLLQEGRNSKHVKAFAIKDRLGGLTESSSQELAHVSFRQIRDASVPFFNRSFVDVGKPLPIVLCLVFTSIQLLGIHRRGGGDLFTQVILVHDVILLNPKFNRFEHCVTSSLRAGATRHIFLCVRRSTVIQQIQQ